MSKTYRRFYFIARPDSYRDHSGGVFLNKALAYKCATQQRLNAFTVARPIQLR
jgi:hypothetical protein